ncbi:MAG: 1-(5-phosphoribosyl)-5-amino-4-imidazole-carboxylate carboxylase [Thermodesulfovibrio sp.]|nr:1-(5-phosphoribosyl)-5-amino-4-imidazole-carboxylate carboxylase [Thermodesulfovibrio sp.]
MQTGKIKEILDDISTGRLTPDKALALLKHLPYEDLSYAKIDHHRHLRQGIPEVIYAAGKTDIQVVAIARAMHKKTGSFLITRAAKKIHTLLRIKEAVFHEAAGMISVGGSKEQRGNILVLTAGTSDMPVAEEAAVTAAFLGSKVETVHDVGVAGLHRLLDNKEAMGAARVIIVAAGMEGALPSVVGGLTDKPIVAVPTSVGYGTSFNGLTALFAMLNSCVPGIAVMNIDNGFGAGCLAHKINILV